MAAIVFSSAILVDPVFRAAVHKAQQQRRDGGERKQDQGQAQYFAGAVFSFRFIPLPPPSPLSFPPWPWRGPPFLSSRETPKRRGRVYLSMSHTQTFMMRME